MVLKSYSKINLSLIVNNKLRNGLHEIQSHFCLINLTDKIEVTKINKLKDRIIFKGPFAKNVKIINNSVNNLLKLLRKLKLISNYYSVVVTKNIPPFGGLGGGTSNAATLLKYFFKKGVSKKILRKVENLIGSDFRIFFYKQGFLKNLKTITSKKKKERLYFLLVYPNIKCSTREIYSKVKKFSKKKTLDLKKINSRNKFIDYISNSRNDLQIIVEKKYPVVHKLLTDISIDKDCYFSRMSGSGSVCYGLFNKERAAKKALNIIKTKYPKFWVINAKTV